MQVPIFFGLEGTLDKYDGTGAD